MYCASQQLNREECKELKEGTALLEGLPIRRPREVSIEGAVSTGDKTPDWTGLLELSHGQSKERISSAAPRKLRISTLVCPYTMGDTPDARA